MQWYKVPGRNLTRVAESILFWFLFFGQNRRNLGITNMEFDAASATRLVVLLA